MHAKAFQEFLKMKSSTSSKVIKKKEAPERPSEVPGHTHGGPLVEEKKVTNLVGAQELSRKRGQTFLSHEDAIIGMFENLDVEDDDGISGLSGLEVGLDDWKKPAAPEYSLSTITAMKGMISSFGANKVFTFPLTRFAFLTTSGAGLMALSTFVHPSQFDQYNQLALLFDECKQVSVSAELTLLYHATAPTTGSLPVVMLANFEHSAYNGSATITISSVNRIPGTKLISSEQTNWPVRIKHKFKGKVWSNINGGTSGSDPSGITGRFNWVLQSTGSITTAYFAYRIVHKYAFRGLV